MINGFNSGNQYEFIIPDDWTGLDKSKQLSFSEENKHISQINFLNVWRNLKGSDFYKTLLLCEDNYKSAGIREILADFTNIHLKKISSDSRLSDEAYAFQPDCIICVCESSSEVCRKMTELLTIGEALKDISFIVMLDDIPESLLGKDKIISRFTFISARKSVNDVKSWMAGAIKFKIEKDFSLSQILPVRQLNIISSYSAGMSTKSIACKYNIECKTVLAHKYLAFKKLGITQRSQKAWVSTMICIIRNWFVNTKRGTDFVNIHLYQ